LTPVLTLKTRSFCTHGGSTFVRKVVCVVKRERGDGGRWSGRYEYRV